MGSYRGRFRVPFGRRRVFLVLMYDPPLPPGPREAVFRLLFAVGAVDSFITVIFSYENILFCTSAFDVGLRYLDCPNRYRLIGSTEVQGARAASVRGDHSTPGVCDTVVSSDKTRKEFKCPYCRRSSFDTLAELGTHLSKTHGLNKRRRQKIYKRMGYGEED